MNQAAQQSRPEVWLAAAAAALVMVADRFTLIMGGMVAKSSGFVNERHKVAAILNLGLVFM